MKRAKPLAVTHENRHDAFNPVGDLLRSPTITSERLVDESRSNRGFTIAPLSNCRQAFAVPNKQPGDFDSLIGFYMIHDPAQTGQVTKVKIVDDIDRDKLRGLVNIVLDTREAKAPAVAQQI